MEAAIQSPVDGEEYPVFSLPVVAGGALHFQWALFRQDDKRH